MKRIILFGTLMLLFAFSMNAQNDTLYVMKNGVVINKQSINPADVDSIIFYQPAQLDYTFTVTFDSQDAEVEANPEIITVESPAITIDELPTPPEKTGFIFDGWWTEENGEGTAFSTETVVTNDITVYAKWDTYSYTVTFDSQDAEVEADPVTIQVESPATTIDELPTPPEKTGFIFDGWWTEENGEGTAFSTETVVTNDITVYAKWDTYSYTVTFDSQDAEVEADPVTIQVESPAITIDELPTPPEKTGLTFGGWFTEVNGEGTEFSATTIVTEDITVYAKWLSSGLLSNISVGEHVLIPEFNAEHTEYEVEVTYHTTQITVTAESFCEDDDIIFSKVQPMNLNVGNNTLTIEVYYGEGIDSRDYTLVITRKSLEFISLLIDEDFEGAFPPESWNVLNNGGDEVWLSSSSTGYSNYTGGSGKFADANSDNAGSGTTMDTDLRTPTMDFSSMENPALTLRSYFRQLGSSYGDVDISIDGGTDWINLIKYNTITNDTPVIFLDDYKDETNVIIRFRYVSSGWNWFWQIDDIRIGDVNMN
ncbi:MAG: InlB B-repeat-containing protein [Bacteroidales bacterium]